MAARVVVVGASGNIGTSLVEALATDPEVGAIVGVARRRPVWTAPKTEWVAADVTEDDLAQGRRVFKDHPVEAPPRGDSQGGGRAETGRLRKDRAVAGTGFHLVEHRERRGRDAVEPGAPGRPA